MVLIGGEAVTAEAWVKADDMQRQVWTWNAAAQSYGAAEAYGRLLGQAWTGQLMEAAA